MRVNVGTIGHVDHGKTTVASALARVLGEVVVVDGQQVGATAPIEIGPHRSERSWSKMRKKARKAKLAELQRKAFTKEPRHD